MHLPTKVLLLLAALSVGVVPLPAQITIMPMGDSITEGFGVDGGYRDPLATDLANANLSFRFVGAAVTGSTPNLVNRGDQHHNGYGSWPIEALAPNLDADKPYILGGQPYGAGNEGGCWLTGTPTRPPEHPDLVLLEIGTNNFLREQGVPLTTFEDELSALITAFHKLSPNTHFLLAGVIPINNSAGFNAQISKYDTYIRDNLVPSMPYTEYVNLYGAFTHPDGTTIPALYQADNIHPSKDGYGVMATTWASAIQPYAKQILPASPQAPQGKSP